MIKTNVDFLKVSNNDYLIATLEYLQNSAGEFLIQTLKNNGFIFTSQFKDVKTHTKTLESDVRNRAYEEIDLNEYIKEENYEFNTFFESLQEKPILKIKN